MFPPVQYICLWKRGSCDSWFTASGYGGPPGSRRPARTAAAHSDVVDDNESRTSRLLARLTHGVLLGWLGEDSWSVEVVDSRLEETGSQSQAQNLLGLQLQLVLGLTHPGEGAVDLQRLWAETGIIPLLPQL